MRSPRNELCSAELVPRSFLAKSLAASDSRCNRVDFARMISEAHVQVITLTASYSLTILNTPLSHRRGWCRRTEACLLRNRLLHCVFSSHKQLQQRRPVQPLNARSKRLQDSSSISGPRTSCGVRKISMMWSMPAPLLSPDRSLFAPNQALFPARQHGPPTPLLRPGPIQADRRTRAKRSAGSRPLRQPQGAGQGRPGGPPRRAGTQGRCGCGAQAVLGRGRACRPKPYAPPPRPPRHRPRPANARPPRPPAAANMNYTYIIRLLLDRRTQATGRPHAGRDPPGLQECSAELHAYSLLRAFCS